MKDVRRLISQALEPVASKLDVSWTGIKSIRGLVPMPIETENALPLVARGVRWSRWFSGTISNTNTEIRKCRYADAKASIKSESKSNRIRKIQKCLFTNEKMRWSMKRYLNQGTFWADSTRCRTSAVFGHILYPLYQSRQIMQKYEQRGTTRSSRGIPKLFTSARREFLAPFPFQKNVFLRRSPEASREKEELCVRLKPSQQSDRHAHTRIFPPMVLCVHINKTTQEVSLRSVRLAVEENQFDLLLPEKVADIRFCAEVYIPSLSQFDPLITHFIESNKSNILNQESFVTPANLTVSIPAHAIREAPTPADGKRNKSSGIKTESDVLVEYTFTSFEHRSSLSGWDSKKEKLLQYTMVDGGRTSGRREEIRMLDSHRPEHAKIENWKEFYNAAMNFVDAIDGLRILETEFNTDEFTQANLDVSLTGRPDVHLGPPPLLHSVINFKAARALTGD